MDGYIAPTRSMSREGIPSRPQEVVSEKSVNNAMGALDRALGEHHGLLKELENRLTCILGPDYPGELQPERKPAGCSLADSIYSNASALNECSCIVKSILNRLQI